MSVVGALLSAIIMVEVNILNAGKVSEELEGIRLSEEASGTTHPILSETVESALGLPCKRASH